MTEPQLHRPVDDDALDALHTIATSAAAVLGHPVLGDDVARDLATASGATAIVTASDGPVLLGAMHLGPPDEAGVVTGSLVITPTARSRGVEAALVRTARHDLRRQSQTGLHYWVFGEAGDPDRPSGPPARELHQMRVDLPLVGAGAAPEWPEGIRTRAFEPGADDEAWVAVNNRSFAADPDQGGWTLSTLHARMAEPWFDLAGLLLAEDDDGLAGFCWTKVHPPTLPFDPKPVGEIYVIGVDPDRQGTGLGRALVAAGLAGLATRGIGVGMLFVDAANAPAVGLYEALGFVTTRTDRMFACAVEGADR